jgi:nicotinate phosphoribosyltransferase
MVLEQRNRALCTDLYELTMALAYFHGGTCGRAAFELYVRELPPNRAFLVSTGLEQVVSYLERLSFSDDQVEYLRKLIDFRHAPDRFFEWLQQMSFTGDLDAVPEGTLIFAGEPVLRVEAPIMEAQLAETFLLSMINIQTLVATKAARVCLAAVSDGRERSVADFGARRAHGPDAAALVARAAYIGGCSSTSYCEAGISMGIPVSGTEAHSFVMAFESEEEAFRQYYRCYGDRAIMLIDTYNTVEGARKARREAPLMRGVRIDSGDLASLSKQVREILCEAGRSDAVVVLSGDLDEYRIADLIDDGAEVDAFGVGTRLATSDDAPYLSSAYKLVAVAEGDAWKPRVKLSAGKATLPGRKQVFRLSDRATGQFDHDLIAAIEEDPPPSAEQLLHPVMRDGRVMAEMPSLDAIRERTGEQLRRLPAAHKLLCGAAPYPVKYSPALQEQLATMSEELGEDTP